MNLKTESEKLLNLNKKRKYTEKNNQQSHRDVWNSNKRSRVYSIKVSEGEKENMAERGYDEIMAENFPNVEKYTNPQIQEA